MHPIKMNQVLPTFPSQADIRDIIKALRSRMFHVFVTRLDAQFTLHELRHKYYIPPHEDWVQKIFPFQEGITLTDILDRKVRPAKEIFEPPMIVTFAGKSRMTLKQLTSAFMSDAKDVEERHTIIGAAPIVS